MSLGDRIKSYEKSVESKVTSDHYFCIRLDGHKFSNFTRSFTKPFDTEFSKAMVQTAYDALCEFNARSAYTQSDEITLIFDKTDPEKNQTHIYDGRYSKLLSLSASYVSTRFNSYLDKKQSLATFDARLLVFSEDTKHDLLNHLIWRSDYDCYRNAVSMYANSLFSHKFLDKKNTDEKIQMLQSKGIDWNTIPYWQKYGVIIKKRLVKFSNDKSEEFLRTRPISISFKLTFSDKNLKLILAHYMNDDMPVDYQVYPH